MKNYQRSRPTTPPTSSGVHLWTLNWLRWRLLLHQSQIHSFRHPESPRCSSRLTTCNEYIHTDSHCRHTYLLRRTSWPQSGVFSGLPVWGPFSAFSGPMVGCTRHLCAHLDGIRLDLRAGLISVSERLCEWPSSPRKWCTYQDTIRITSAVMCMSCGLTCAPGGQPASLYCWVVDIHIHWSSFCELTCAPSRTERLSARGYM